MTVPSTITSATRRLAQGQIDVLRGLKPGQRIRIVQTVRVGARKWQTTAEGVFRELNYLATGLATERVPEDDIVVPVLHFARDNGELSSVCLDENSQVSVVG
ncbi:MAG TPA: hypothetical protein VKD90_06585 [Gemmataceae bacterium]|nr:hypothetical protein [Gemmataceae bacterium]